MMWKAAYQISVWLMAGILMYAKMYTIETYILQNKSNAVTRLARMQRQLQ